MGRYGDVVIAARDGYSVGTNNFGIEAWVLPYGNGYNVFCCEAYPANNYTAQIFASGGNSTGLYLGVTNNQDGTYSVVAAVITDIPNGHNGVMPVGNALPVALITNSWTHLAAVRDNGTNTFYVNGVPYGPSTTDTPSTNVPPSNGNQTGIRLGACQDDEIAYCGLIDEARAFTFSPGAFNVTDLLYPAPSATVPSIVVQPTSATAWDGGAVPFSVQAATSPNLTYQWKHNGTNLLGATKSTLFLPLVTRAADDGGVCDCVVSNTATGLTATSSNATLSVVALQTNNCANYESLVSGQAGLVAFFPVAYNTGTTLTNVKYSANSGTLEGAASYDGRTDRSFDQRALALNQAGNLGDVMLANDPDYTFPNGEGTIEALVYMDNFGGYLNSTQWKFPTIFSVGFPDRTSPTFTSLVGVSAAGDALEYSSDFSTHHELADKQEPYWPARARRLRVRFRLGCHGLCRWPFLGDGCYCYAAQRHWLARLDWQRRELHEQLHRNYLERHDW